MAVKKLRGLGRGLSQLLGDDIQTVAKPTVEGGVVELNLSMIQAGKYQPRSHWELEKLNALSNSISEQGVINPIIVRTRDDGMYEILAGERRYRASKMAGKLTIPAIVREAEDKEALAIALVENMQREDLNAIEEATGVRRLIDEFGYTHEQAAKAIGRSRSATTNLLRLLNLPDAVQKALLDGLIEMGHARAILGAPESMQIALCDEIIAKKLSVREVEQLIAQGTEIKVKEKLPRIQKSQELVDIEEQLSKLLGARVAVRVKANNSGQVVVRFADLEELSMLIERMNHEQPKL